MKHPHAAQLKDNPGFDGHAALGRVEGSRFRPVAAPGQDAISRHSCIMIALKASAAVYTDRFRMCDVVRFEAAYRPESGFHPCTGANEGFFNG